MNYLVGLPAFLGYFILSIALLLTYAVVYTRITRHDEMLLIRVNVPAAAVAFTGSMLGFALPLASAVAHSVSLIDCLLWGLIALVVQTGAYFGVRYCLPDLSTRIENGQMATGCLLAGASLAVGVLNAACMTY